MERISNQIKLNQIKENTILEINKTRCRVLICAGTGCLAGGSAEIYKKICELAKNDKDIEIRFEDEVPHGEITVKKSGCHGFCEMGPLMRIEPQGILYTKVKLSDCEEI